MTTPRDPFAPEPPPPSGYGPSGHGSPGYGPSGYGSPGYGAPAAPYGAGKARTEPKAIVAIVLAVLAWTPTVPFIGAIAALVLARMARRDIEASGGRLTGDALCTWATVLSWVHLVVVTLIFVVFLLLVAVGVSL